MRSTLHIPLALAVLGLASCSTYYSYRYEPAPLEAPLDWANGGQGRGLISVLGVRKADGDSGRPAGVEVRLRVENLGEKVLELDASDLALATADLVSLAATEVLPAEPPGIAPGGSGVIDCFFAFPPGVGHEALDLGGLNLRWSVLCEGQRLTTGSSFRLTYAYGDPYASGPVHVGFGFGFYHGG